MWPFSRKAKIERLRETIERDADLSEDQKRGALMRLEEKERSLTQTGGYDLGHPFGLAKIADESQGVFETLLPSIVGRIQLKRLQTRNEMIQEMRRTLNELSETKRAWERLKNIDAEVAYDRMVAYQKGEDARTEHEKKMVKLRHETDRIREEREREQATHAIKMKELQTKLAETERREIEPPPTPKSEAEKINEEYELKKLRLQKELELEELRFEAERKRKSNESTFDNYENYRAAEEAVRNSGLTGDALKQAINSLRVKFGFSLEETEAE